MKRLSEETFKLKEGAIVEIDLRKCFNMIPHEYLKAFLEEKISDRRFLRLIDALIKTPLYTKEGVIPSELGCPQGSIISPVLANIYLHHVIDKWFEAINTSHLRGQGKAIRFADDAVFVFHSKTEAEKFAKVLPKRLAKYGLELNEAKSGILPAGSFFIQKMVHSGIKPPTFKFLGFLCYWGLNKSGKFYRLKFKSRNDRLQNKVNGLKKFLKENRNAPNTKEVLDRVKRVVVGWMNYHSISDNIHQVWLFDYLVKRSLLRWFRRRSQRSRMTFIKLLGILEERRFPVCKIRVQMF
jgi:group II intron reverse transcriptase/maturase